MAEIVNLRRARKAKARREAELAAAENRVIFGRSRADRDAVRAETRRAEREHEGHRRDSAESCEPEGS